MPSFELGRSTGDYLKQKAGMGDFYLEDYVPSLGNIGAWAKSLFTGATAGAIDSVEKGKGPMQGAGASLGDSLIVGMKSKEGLDSQSPSKRAIAEGLNVRLGFFQGLTDPSINITGAALSLSNEAIAGLRGGGFVGGSQRAYLEQVSQNPTVKAFFDAISKGEGGQLDIMAGGRHVNSGRLHPGEIIPQSQWFRTSKGPSSAAGLYQITRTNWRRISAELGLDNWSDPHQQLIAALKILMDRGGLPPLLSGNIGAAAGYAAQDWTSVFGSTIGGGKSLSKAQWMNNFKEALGGTPIVTAAPVSVSTPLPVTVVGPSGDGLQWQPWKPSPYGGPDFNTGAALFATASQPVRRSRTINGGSVDAGNIYPEEQPLSTSMRFIADPAFLTFKKPLELLGQSATSAATSLNGLTEEQIKAKQAEALSGEGKAKKPKPDRLFGKALTWEGAAGDFKGGVEGFLSEDLWKGKFLKDHLAPFGMGLLKDIQHRAASDLSGMLTQMLFGGRKDPNDPKSGLTGGLFGSLFSILFGGHSSGGAGSALAGALGGGSSGGGGGLGGFFKSFFGSLFGGGRASGGPMEAGRFYMAGEQGRELIWMGGNSGHAYNASQTRAMMMGGNQPQRFILVDSERAAQEHYNASDRNLIYRLQRNQRKVARINRYT
jgi:muramidase (phage lysozyme)